MARFIPDETLAPYYAIAKSSKPLTIKEEAALARTIETGTKKQREQAAQRLVLSHVPLIIKIALRYRKSGLPLSDLVQEGIVGLYRATNGKFDPTKARFSTYGFAWIKDAIHTYVRENKGVVRAPATAHRKRDEVNRVIASNTRNGTVDYGAVGKVLKMKPGKIAMLQNLGVESSLNLVIGEGDTEIVDLLEDPNPVEPCARQEESNLHSSLNEALDSVLTARERRIVTARVGMGEEEDEVATLEKLAVEFSLTRERVRQIQMRALEKLRDSPQAAFLHEFFE